MLKLDMLSDSSFLHFENILLCVSKDEKNQVTPRKI